MDLSDRKVVVVGMGASGRAAAALCVARGAQVTGVDVREAVEPLDGVTLELGPHRRETFVGADLLVVSPGVSGDQPDVVAAEAAGVQVLGELGLAATLLSDLPMVGITGTNGKSTVTSFTGQLLSAAGRRPFVGGNLGNPLCNAVPRKAWERPGVDIAVVECSSYQLERAGPFRPRAAVVLNLTPDHLARHGTMAAYGAAKARIFRNQGPDDSAIIPLSSPDVLSAAEGAGQGRRLYLGESGQIRRQGNEATLELPDGTVLIDLAGLEVPGDHNKDNAAVAAALALLTGALLEDVQRAIPRLVALAHRMEVVAEQHGVLWINDSKATNVDAAMVGLSGLARPAVVLLGGQAKGPGFDALAPALGRHRAVLTFGGSGPAIADELEAVGVAVERCDTLQDAIGRARALARTGDAVLLSPGCASFDAFTDFEHRGRAFRAWVLEEGS